MADHRRARGRAVSAGRGVTVATRAIGGDQPCAAAGLTAERRAQITQAAGELFGRRGYRAATMRDIALRIGVSPGLIYNYVEDKEQLLFLVLDSLLDAYATRIPAALAGLCDPLARFAAAVDTYCRIVAERPEATLLAYQESRSLRRPLREHIKRREVETNALIAECISDGIAAGLFRPVDAELAAYRAVMMAHGWALKTWRLAGRMTIDDYIADSLEMLLGALVTPLGARRRAEAAR